MSRDIFIKLNILVTTL